MKTSKAQAIAKIERELDNLASRSADLEKRKTQAQEALDIARAERKAALAGDPNADLTAHSAKVSEALETVETVESVLDDLAEQTEDAERRLEDAKDGEARSKAAKELNGIASDFDTAAAELEAALEHVGKAFDKMTAAIPETVHVTKLEGSSQLRDGEFPSFEASERDPQPHDLARAVLAEGLARVCPIAFPSVSVWMGSQHALQRAHDLESLRPTFTALVNTTVVPAKDAKQTASLLVTDRLRRRAEAITAGEAEPTIHDSTPIAPHQPSQRRAIEDVEIVPNRNLKYRTKPDARPCLIGKAFPQRLPEHIAQAALDAGLAHHRDTPQAQELLDQEEKQKVWAMQTGALHPDFCEDLGLIRHPDDDPEDGEIESIPDAAE